MMQQQAEAQAAAAPEKTLPALQAEAALLTEEVHWAKRQCDLLQRVLAEVEASTAQWAANFGLASTDSSLTGLDPLGDPLSLELETCPELKAMRAQLLEAISHHSIALSQQAVEQSSHAAAGVASAAQTWVQEVARLKRTWMQLLSDKTQLQVRGPALL